MLNKKCFSHQKQIEYLGIFLLVVNNLLAQTEWTKYHGNPVLGEWPNWAGDPAVIRDGDTLRMWMTGGYPNASLDTLCQIGYAVSIDGIN
jgi:hypothetical protein